jgi:hypothetical protein
MKVWVVFLLATFFLGARAARRQRELSVLTLLGLGFVVAVGLYTYSLV